MLMRMGGKSKNYLPEAADSRLSNLDAIETSKAIAERLRLRLHVASRLLFGDTIYMSEGWSLDSTSFLIVVGEILQAIDELSRISLPPRGIDRYSPFRIEIRNSSSYLAVHDEYLARDDCEWSGNRRLREFPDVRRGLRERLGRINPDGPVDAARVADAFHPAVENNRVVAGLGSLARYLSLNEQDRIVRGRVGPASFIENVLPYLREIDALIRVTGTQDNRLQMKDYLDRIERNRAGLTSSSSVLAAARGLVSDDLFATLEHVTRLAYMQVTTRKVGATYSAPILNDGAPTILKEVDARLAAIEGPPQALAFTGIDEGGSVLMERLARVSDWRPIWQQLISLALRPEWRAIVERIRRDASDNGNAGEVLRHPDFDKLERLLDENCPALVLRQTRAEYLEIGFRIGNLRVEPNRIGQALDTGLQAAVVAVPGWLLAGPAGAGAALFLWTAANKVAEGTVASMVSPFCGKTALRSSLFRLFEK